MKNRRAAGLSFGKKLALGAAAMAALVAPVVVGIVNPRVIVAQSATDWQAAAGGKAAFEVASVKPSTGEFVSPTVPFNAGDASKQTTGYFRADFPLWSYIQFAYKLWWPAMEQEKEIARLPKWVTTDRYTVDARMPGKPTKDQMRLMVQTLLADRFKLQVHFEMREIPVLALTLLKPGKLGPKLIAHADGRSCGDFDAATHTPVPAKVIRGEEDAGPENFPPFCDSVALIRRPGGMQLLGYRNATMEMLAGALSGVVVQDRPVVDRTGLSGRFDFTLDWAPDPKPAAPTDAPDAASEPVGPAAVQALRDQLGLKAESIKAPAPILVVDRVERPTAN